VTKTRHVRTLINASPAVHLTKKCVTGHVVECVQQGNVTEEIRDENVRARHWRIFVVVWDQIWLRTLLYPKYCKLCWKGLNNSQQIIMSVVWVCGKSRTMCQESTLSTTMDESKGNVSSKKRKIYWIAEGWWIENWYAINKLSCYQKITFKYKMKLICWYSQRAMLCWLELKMCIVFVPLIPWSESRNQSFLFFDPALCCYLCWCRLNVSFDEWLWMFSVIVLSQGPFMGKAHFLHLMAWC